MRMMSSTEAAVNQVVMLDFPDDELKGRCVELVKQLETKVGDLEAFLSDAVSTNRELKLKLV